MTGSWNENPQRRSKLGDGCYHIFLDVGANIGVHARFLYEPHRYGLSRRAVPIFAQTFGKDRDNRDFCVFAFEPNPAHRERLQNLSLVYNAMGWRYVPIHAGVGDTEGNLTFYHMHDQHKSEWGFNMVKQKKKGKTGVPEVIPVIRLAKWIQEEIEGRIIPETTYRTRAMIATYQNQTTTTNATTTSSNDMVPPDYHQEPPKVVMKLDIEGMEYVTLPDLLFSGALCNNVDQMFGEFHVRQKWIFPIRSPGHPGDVIPHSKSANNTATMIKTLMKQSLHCKTVYSSGDDESYLHDGIPFPITVEEAMNRTRQSHGS